MVFKLFSQFLPALVESSEASYSDLGFKQADKKRFFWRTSNTQTHSHVC